MERNPDPVIANPVFRPARDFPSDWSLAFSISIPLLLYHYKLFKRFMKVFKTKAKKRDCSNVPKELEPIADESGLSDLIAPEIISNGIVLPPHVLVETTELGLDPDLYQAFLHRKVYNVPAVADETIDVATSSVSQTDGRPKSPRMYNAPFETTDERPKAPKVYSAPTEKTDGRSKARKILSPVLKKKPEPTTMPDPEPEERWGI